MPAVRAQVRAQMRVVASFFVAFAGSLPNLVQAQTVERTLPPRFEQLTLHGIPREQLGAPFIAGRDLLGSCGGNKQSMGLDLLGKRRSGKRFAGHACRKCQERITFTDKRLHKKHAFENSAMQWQQQLWNDCAKQNSQDGFDLLRFSSRST